MLSSKHFDMALHYDHGRWQNNRAIFLKIGLALGIAFCIFILQLEVHSSPIKPYAYEPAFLDEFVMVPPTKQVKKKLPKPKPPKSLAPLIEIDDDPEPIEEPEIDVEEKPKTDSDLVFVGSETSLDLTETKPAPIVEPIIEEEDNTVYDIVDRMPCYEDCFDVEDFSERKTCTDKLIMQQVYAQLKYPSIARSNSIQGMVIASFTVTKQGHISDVKILRDIGGGCGDAVVEVLKELNQMLPGKKAGKPVNVSYKMPVKFVLN